MGVKIQKILLVLIFSSFCTKNKEKISFTLKNDLALDVTIATESSNIILQSGAAYRLERNLGEKLYLVKKNEPQKLLFIVKESHKNKLLYISQFL